MSLLSAGQMLVNTLYQHTRIARAHTRAHNSATKVQKKSHICKFFLQILAKKEFLL